MLVVNLQLEEKRRSLSMVSVVTLGLLLAFSAVVGWLYYRKCRYWASRMPRNTLTTGYAFPLIGNLYQMMYNPDGILTTGLKIADRLGVYETMNRVLFWMGEMPLVIMMKAEDMEILLGSSKPILKPDLVYKPVRSFFGDGLITLNGDSWLHHRKVLTPVFHFKILERYFEVFERRAEVLVEELSEPKLSGVEIDALPHMCRTVSHTICETAFGMSERLASSAEIRERDRFLAATEIAFKIIEKRVMKPWLMVDALFRLSPLYYKQKNAEQVINDYALRIIRMKKEEIATEGLIPTSIEDDDGRKKKVAFLDLVLREAKDVFSEQEVLQEVRTLVTVQQTTATTLSFIFVMLAIHQDIQEQVYNEIIEHEDTSADRPYFERLNEMKFLERVIKETMRLYPVTLLFARDLKEDLVFSDTVLPAGFGVSCIVFLTHRDKRFYGPNPEKFDPDHFLPERCRTRHPYAYIPFSAGPRNCIGQKYAMLQMKAIVGKVVRSLRVFPGKGCRTQEELRLDMDTFLHIRGGFNVRFVPRG